MDDSILHKKLKEICGPDFIFDEPLELKYFSVDGLVPRAVAAPATAEEALSVVSLARAETLSVIPRGGGLHMNHGYPPERADLVILTSRLGQVMELEPENLTAVVEAGIPLSELEHRLSKHRVFFPVNPYQADMATPGGVVAANSSGHRRIRYGSMRDRLLGIKLINGRAEMISSGARTVKNVAGYDLSKLIVGSLGTLGLVTEMILKLEPLPEKFQANMGIFPDISPAASASQAILEFNPLPCFLELLCPDSLPRLYPLPGEKPSPDPGYALVAGSEGTKETVEHQSQEIRQIFKKHGAREIIEFSHGLETEIDWLLKEAYFEETRVSVKASFPPASLEVFLEQVEKLAGKLRLHVAKMASPGTGVAHVFILHDEPREVVNDMSAFIQELRDFCEEMKGNVVIMNAPLELKQKVPVFKFSSDDSELLSRIKSAFDPDNIFSPARMF